MSEVIKYYVHETSYIDDNVEIGEGTKIWHFCHIQSGARIGKNCSLGQNVNVSNNVIVGNGVKLQNNVSLYEGVELKDFVFCGPSCVFTNDLTPRAKYPKGHAGYKKTLVEEGSHVSHFLAEFPAHPSIPRSCAIVGASYDEFIDIDKFTIPDNTSLVVVTGSTMDHKVIDEELFKKVIDMAHEKDIPVLVDDASGARLRTAVFNQAKATELGADLVVTSTDKLMPGPRGGLMAGREDLIDAIKVKANQFGLEAQPPLILAMVNGIKNYTEENLVKAMSRKEEFFDLLSKKYEMFEKTPTGVMVSEDSLKNQLDKLNVETELSKKDCCFLWAMVLLKDFGIITIPAVGMPGASATIRIDLSTQDVIDMDLNELYEKIDQSFERFLDLSQDVEKSKELIFY